MSDNRCENCQKTFDKCRDDMAFVQAYYQGLEEMKTLLTRERDEAHARVAELEKELSVTNDIYTDEHEERGMYQSRCADLEAHAATLTGLANQYKAERNSLEETCRMHSARVVELEKRIEEQKAGCATLHAECERLGKEVVYQRKLYEEAIDNKPPARRDVESDHYYNAAFDGVDYGKVAYERFRELPATPKDAAPWDRLKGAERNEWRAIVEPVVERARAEKSRAPIDADDETIERFAVIVGENGGESLSSAEMERIAKAVIASITDTTKPTKPARAVEEPEARLEVKQTKWVCVEEGRAEAMREAWQKAISNGDNARVIFADGSQES